MNDSELLAGLIQELDQINSKLNELDYEKEYLIGERTKLENQVQIIEAYRQLKLEKSESKPEIEDAKILSVITVEPSTGPKTTTSLGTYSGVNLCGSAVISTSPDSDFLNLLQNFGEAEDASI